MKEWILICIDPLIHNKEFYITLSKSVINLNQGLEQVLKKASHFEIRFSVI